MYGLVSGCFPFRDQVAARLAGAELRVRTLDFPVQGISPCKGFPFIRDFSLYLLFLYMGFRVLWRAQLRWSCQSRNASWHALGPRGTSGTDACLG